MMIPPAESLTLSQLADYIRLGFRHSIHAYWCIGKACELAKKHEPHGGFKKWCKTTFPNISYSTLHRCHNLHLDFTEAKVQTAKSIKALYGKRPASTTTGNRKSLVAIVLRSLTIAEQVRKLVEGEPAKKVAELVEVLNAALPQRMRQPLAKAA